MMIAGVVIFVFGLIFLLRNLGVLSFPGSFWSLFYPLLIMGLGFVVLLATYEGRKFLKKLKKIFSADKEVK